MLLWLARSGLRYMRRSRDRDIEESEDGAGDEDGSI